MPACLRIAHTVDAAMVMAEAGEFTLDAPIAPRWAFSREADDDLASFGCGGWPAGPVWVGPVVRDEASMPGQDGLRLDEEARPAVAAERAGERGEDRSVGGFETRSRHLTVQDRELMSEDEDLGISGTIAATVEHQQADHEADKTVEAGHPPILTGFRPRRSRQREPPGQPTQMSFRPPQGGVDPDLGRSPEPPGVGTPFRSSTQRSANLCRIPEPVTASHAGGTPA